MGDDKAVEAKTFCCKMRAKFVISIIAVDNHIPDPMDIADFLDWDNKSPNGHPIIYLAYCAFCGAKLPRTRSRLIDLAKEDDDEGEEWKAGTVD